MGQLIEIVLFALLAVYMFYRLWMVFGNESEEDQQRRENNKSYTPPVDQSDDKVINLPIKPRAITSQEEEQQEDSDFVASVRDGIRQIKLIAPTFNPHQFLKGAKAAYKMIIEAFASADLETLTELTSAKVLASFKTAIDDRIAQQWTFNSTIESFDKIDIESITLKETLAMISVRYRTRQINFTTTSDGVIIDNPAKISVNVTDIWTFSRDLKSEDPNWQLISTKSESYRDA